MPTNPQARQSVTVHMSESRRTKVLVKNAPEPEQGGSWPALRGIYYVHTYLYEDLVLSKYLPPNLPGPYTCTMDWTLVCLRTHILLTSTSMPAYCKQASDLISCLAVIVLVASSLVPPGVGQVIGQQGCFFLFKSTISDDSASRQLG